MDDASVAVTLRPPIADLRVTAGDVEALAAELANACDQLLDHRDVVAALLTIAGDLSGAMPSAERAGPRLRCLELLPQPVIAVLGGDVFGVALELALACDIRIATRNARFALPSVAAGTMPSAGGTQRLPRLIGRARAAELVLLGEAFEAPAALAYGLINHVEADEAAAHSRAEAIAMRIAERGPLAVRYAKEAMLRGLDLPLEQALRYETDLTVILQTTADRAEGVRAFLEKRAPEFRGT